MALEEGRVVRTSVLIDERHMYYRLGSGYLVADGLVLTAAHVLQIEEGISPRNGQAVEVSLTGRDWYPGTVAWVNADLDVAVVDCRHDGQTPGCMKAGGGVRWGKLAGSEPLMWNAVGFPAASRELGTSRRQAEHAFGHTSPISKHETGQLALTIESRQAVRGNAPWAGLSGAAVFCGGALAGVVTTDPGSYQHSLEARRAEEFATDAVLLQLLGGELLLEEISEKPREPGLADLRSTLPYRNPDFTGREADFAALAGSPHMAAVNCHVLVGDGGIGKSALATEYAHRRLQSGEVDLAWWFVADDRNVLLAKMAAHYRQLTGIAGGIEDAEVTAIALRNWLQNCPYRWLIIFDNAEPAVIDGILPERGRGEVIVTSRATDWPRSGTREITELSPAEATTLLAKITGLPADDSSRELAYELGYLALAIEQAGAYMREVVGTSYLDYLQALRTDPLAIFKADLAGQESVAARVWRRSLDHVTKGQVDHPAAILLGVLSYLAPHDIPRLLLRPATVKASPLLAGLGIVKVNLALGELAAYSLIRLYPDTIRIHRLILHLTRLNAEEHDRGAGYAATTITLLDQTPPEPASLVAELLPHIKDASGYAEDLGVAFEPTVDALNQTAAALIEAGQLAASWPLLEQARRIAAAHLGTDHPGTLRTRRNLALWHSEAGQVQQAIIELTELVADRTRVFGLDDPETLYTRSNLAGRLGESGQVQKAIAELTDLLSHRTQVLGPGDPDTLATRSNLAYWHGRAGLIPKAVAEFTELLADCRRTLGPEHPETLRARKNLAFWHGESGQPQLTIAELTELLADCRRVLGPVHPETLSTRNDLAFWHGRAGNAGEAVAEFTGLLADRARMLGPDHPETLRARNNLAYWHARAGNIQEAIDQYTQLLADRTRVLGPDHPDTLQNRSNLGFWYSRAGNIQEAIDQYTQLLADRTRVLGPDHPDTLHTRNDLGFCHGRGEQVQEAIVQFTQLVADCGRILGSQHPETLRTRNNLAYWHGRAGNIQEAIDQYTQLLADHLLVLGPDHSETLKARNHLAYWDGKAGHIRDAIDQYSQLVVDSTRALGPDHPDTLDARSRVANWHGTAGQVPEAVTELTALLTDRTRVLGPHHRDTDRTRSDLARWQARRNDGQAR